MNVELIASTNVKNVLDYIGNIAKVCYSSNPDDPSRVAVACARNGHASVFEHMSFTFKVDGISRACSHQLVRHRLASFTQESQRYVEVDTCKDWYVTPKGIDIDYYHDMMVEFSDAYNQAVESGIKLEDARYLLPNATKTNIVVTMNMREFYHFLKLRKTWRAQEEIKNLAIKMEREVVKSFPELAGFEVCE